MPYITMDIKALLVGTEKFRVLAEDDKAGIPNSDKPTMPIPPTSNAEVVGIPSSRPQSDIHRLRQENRELRLYLSMLCHDPFISEYPIKDIKGIVEQKMNQQ